jgi:hypothetical protein
MANKDEQLIDELLAQFGMDTSIEKKEFILNLGYGLEGIASQLWRIKDKTAKDAKGNIWTIEMTDSIKSEVTLKMNGIEQDKFILSHSNSLKTAYFRKYPVVNKRYRE